MSPACSLLPCLGAIALLLLSGCSPSPAPLSWLPPRLRSVDVLELRFAARPEGSAVLTFLDPATGAMTAQGRLDVTATRAAPGGDGTWTLVVDVEPPMVKTLTMLSDDGASWTLDAQPALDRLLGPVDALTGDRLNGLLSGLDAIRVDQAKRRLAEPFAATVDGARALAEHLARVGLDRERLADLRTLLPGICAQGAGPGTELGRRLLPLRYCEAVFGEADGVRLPWPSIDLETGVRFRAAAEVPEAVHRAAVARERTTRDTPHHADANQRDEEWLWLAPPGVFGGRGSEGVDQVARLAAVFRTDTQVVPERRDGYHERHVWSFYLTGDAYAAAGGTNWRLYMLIRKFDRAATLDVTVNGRGPLRLAPSGLTQVHTPGYRATDATLVDLPLPAGWVAPGANEMVLRPAEWLASESVPLPMQLAELGLYPEGAVVDE